MQISFSEQKCFDCLFGTAEMFPGLWQRDLEGRLGGLNVLEKKNNCNLCREGMHRGGSEGERKRFACSWAEIGSFLTERVVKHWKGLPWEVFKE